MTDTNISEMVAKRKAERDAKLTTSLTTPLNGNESYKLSSDVEKPRSEPSSTSSNGATPTTIIEPDELNASGHGATRQMRIRMLAACVQDGDWYATKGKQVIIPEHFVTKEEKQLIQFFNDYHNKYDAMPDVAVLDTEFATADELVLDLLAEVYDTLEVEAKQLQYARDKAEEYYRTQEQARITQHLLVAYDSGTREEVDKLLKQLQDLENFSVIESLNEWRSPAEVDEYDFESVRWIVSGMIKEGMVNLFYGESSVGKTWLKLDMCKHIIFGEPFMGLATTESVVLWIDEENREDEMMVRLYGFRAAMTDEERAKFDANFKFRTLGKTCKNRFNLNDAEAVRRLIKQIQSETDKPVMVVFDSMGAVSYSDRDTISDNKQAIKIMNILADITVSTRATMSAIHHPTKDKSNMFGGVFMTNLVDLNVEVSKYKGDKEFDKDRNVLMLTAPKVRRTNKIFKNGFLLEFITDGDDELDRAINPRFIDPEDVVELAKSGMKLIRNEAKKRSEAVTDWLHSNPETVVGKSLGVITKDVKAMAENDEYLPTPAGKDVWRDVINKLVTDGMYKWNNENINASNRVLLKGDKYEDWSKQLNLSSGSIS